MLVERVDQDGLDRLRPPFVAVVLAAAAGRAQPHPVGSPVAGGREPIRLYEGLQQHGPMGVKGLPVLRQTAHVAAQQPGGQVRDLHKGQNQETGIVDDPVQALLSPGGRPADEGVPTVHLPGGRPQARQAMGRPWEKARYFRCSPTVWQ